MAKKKSSAKRQKKQQKLPQNVLPQNILPMGERVEEDKNVYISQKTYKQIHQFTKRKTINESGGVLVGTVIEDFGKSNILISDFIEAKYCEATPTTLTFTHETWEYIHKKMDKEHPGKKIVGWIHTHPDFGIFLSEYDKFIHQNFFSEINQIAYVVDPIQKIEGFYFWINGKIERCKGFYIYDETGVKIKIAVDKEETSDEAWPESVFCFRNVLLTILCVAVVFLTFSHFSLSAEIKKLKAQQEAIVSSANESLYAMQQEILTLESELAALQEETRPAPDRDAEATDKTQDDTIKEPATENDVAGTEETIGET